MAGGTVIELSPNWPVVIAALRREVTPIMREEQLLLTRGAALEAKLTAQSILDGLVYDAPLPPSAFFDGWTENGHPGTFVNPTGPAYYLERSRTGRTRNAIKSETVIAGEETIAKAFVDRGDYPAWFYALALEFGMLDRYATYYPRPFWRLTSEVMRSLYREKGMEAARRIRTRINGRFHA